ncbi:hypothetical protein [Actinoplanes sp. DH11]|uniref:hypothetical protein n=1 Tax=Actinoplanes sp. DH11 TaxID=2857011 RepID=UPI001E33F277|nr:hypothetical protein [Actinoplanes sp. DH11]
MTDMTHAAATEALTAADQGLRRGAGAVRPRNTTRFVLVTGLLSIAVGTTFDIPASLWGVGAILRFPLPLVICAGWALYVRREWPARPRPAGYGRVVVTAFFALHLLCFAAASLAGIALREAGTPLPFTAAGLVYALLMIPAVAFAAHRLAPRYADRMARQPR